MLVAILERLDEQTGETAHVWLCAGRDLGTVGVVESTRTKGVHIEAGLSLRLHATASRIVFSAFARPELRNALLARQLAAFTATTPTTRDSVAARIAEARACGFARADQTFESEVHGVALPLFGPDGLAIGALAVASPASRQSAVLEATILTALAPAAREVSLGLDGRVPTNPPPAWE